MNIPLNQTSVSSRNSGSKSDVKVLKKVPENKAFNLLLDTLIKEGGPSLESLIENNSSELQNTQEELETSREQEEVKDQMIESADSPSKHLFLTQMIQMTTNRLASMDPDESSEKLLASINGGPVNLNEMKQKEIKKGQLALVSQMLGEAPSKIAVNPMKSAEETLLKVQSLVKQIIESNQSPYSTIKMNNTLVNGNITEWINGNSMRFENSARKEGELIGDHPQNLVSPREVDRVNETSLETDKKLTNSMIPQLILDELSHELNKLATLKKENPRESFAHSKILFTELQSESSSAEEEGHGNVMDSQNSVQEERVTQSENQEKMTIEESHTIPEEVVLEDVDLESQVDLVELPKVTKEQQVTSNIKQPEGLIRLSQLPTELSDLIAQRLQVMKNGEESQIRIKLAPESLGQLDIRISSIDGKLTAQIATIVAGSKEIIESQLHQLRQTLLHQGVQLDKLEVIQQPQSSSQSSHMQDGRSQQGQQFDQGKNRGSKRKGEYEVEENVSLTQRLEEGTSVGINYSV